MAFKIDAHHHFWKYSPKEYGWISASMAVIKRDFLPADLQKEIAAVGIDAVVSVQARQTLEETRWLLELASRSSFIKGVVGWVPLVDPAVSEALDRFAGEQKLKAVRHIVQDEPEDRYLLGEDFNRGIKELARTGLVYDILIFERHLPYAIQFVDRHPNQVFVLDHIAKPKIKEKVVSPWRENMKELAKRKNVYCKLSGMATEGDRANWTEADLKPYFETAIEAFGPKRLMFGSDWPVALLATGYRRWFETVNHAIARLSQAERDRILGGTAAEAYKLSV